MDAFPLPPPQVRVRGGPDHDLGCLCSTHRTRPINDRPHTRLNAALEGRYRVEREIGEGGMATVYLAEDLRHERKVRC